MTHRITLIPGDGIGPEVTAATLLPLSATGLEFDFEEVSVGEAALRKFGTPLPEPVLESLLRNKVGLKGPITTPIGTGFRSVNVGLRQALNLYANVRPARSFEGVPSRYKGLDLVVIRENTEGLYSGVEHFVDPEHNAAETISIVTRKASERIVRYAFEYARREGRKKVTAVHKANILKATSGLFLECAQRIAKEYPQIQFEDRIVDNMAMQLALKPEGYDVIVTTNLFGDILSDLCAGLVGGLGIAPSANIGEEVAVFEPVHGSAPKYAGQNKMNPTAMILASCMMLRHLGEVESAERIEAGVRAVLKEGKVVTYDLGGKASTTAMAEEIVRRMDSPAP